MKTEILYGIHPVTEAIKAQRRTVFEILIANEKPGKRLTDIISVADLKKIPISRISQERLNKIAGTPTTQGIGARVSAYPIYRLSDAVDRAWQKTEKPFFLLLDHIVDSNNLGALVRTGLGFGVDGIIITKDRAALPTPAVSKVSAGALEHIQLIRIVNMVSAIERLKGAGIWVMGMDRGKGRSILSADLTEPVGIVIGGEEKGIRPLVKKHCDDLLSLPQQGPLNSFNASVAGGIVMFEIFRQRQGCSR